MDGLAKAAGHSDREVPLNAFCGDLSFSMARPKHKAEKVPAYLMRKRDLPEKDNPGTRVAVRAK